MHIYKELSFVGNKATFDQFVKNAPSFATGEWKYVTPSRMMQDYIAYDYLGSKAEKAEVIIIYGTDLWRSGIIKVGNIIPLQKNQLTIEEYNDVLDLFYAEIIKPNVLRLNGITIVGPESDVFDPLNYISPNALEKLKRFCNAANKATGSSHPSDEERWFDFITQTVDDDKTFDYDIIFRFLMDEDYWGKKDPTFAGVMGHFAWDEEHARELATEYDNYVRLLKYYKDKKWKEKYEAAQR